MPSFYSHIDNLIKALGVVKTIEILLRRAFRIKRPLLVGPDRLSLRPTDSDMFVYGQVFGAKEYNIEPLRKDHLTVLCKNFLNQHKTPIIIDGGGNVGYSAVFFAKLFPLATVISVEPDPKTFEVLTFNSRNFPRIKPVLGAIWEHSSGVSLDDTSDASWGRMVKDEGLTPSFTIEHLLETVANSQVVILKLDIEGAEHKVIKHSAETIKTIPCILIEPHDFIFPDRNSLAPLWPILSGRPVDTLLQGENIVFFATDLFSAS